MGGMGPACGPPEPVNPPRCSRHGRRREPCVMARRGFSEAVRGAAGGRADRWRQTARRGNPAAVQTSCPARDCPLPCREAAEPTDRSVARRTAPTAPGPGIDIRHEPRAARRPQDANRCTRMRGSSSWARTIVYEPLTLISEAAFTGTTASKLRSQSGYMGQDHRSSDGMRISIPPAGRGAGTGPAGRSTTADGIVTAGTVLGGRRRVSTGSSQLGRAICNGVTRWRERRRGALRRAEDVRSGAFAAAIGGVRGRLRDGLVPHRSKRERPGRGCSASARAGRNPVLLGSRVQSHMKIFARSI